MRLLSTLAALSTFTLLGAACIGTTGGELVAFDALAGGPAAHDGGAYAFETGRGYGVRLDLATIHVGALYLNQSQPTSVSRDTSCVLAGIYVGELTEGLDVDLLSGALVPFPVEGSGTSERARTAEVWLSGGNIDAQSDPTIIARVAGEATRGGERWPFEGSITISTNRQKPAPDPALPGSEPICKQRVVSPIPVDLELSDGGTLVLRVDPARWFDNVDFAQLEQVGDDPPAYRFRDDDSDQPSRNLYGGVRSSVAFSVSFEN